MRDENSSISSAAPDDSETSLKTNLQSEFLATTKGGTTEYDRFATAGNSKAFLPKESFLARIRRRNYARINLYVVRRIAI